MNSVMSVQRSSIPSTVAALCLSGLSLAAFAQEKSPIQSKANPFNLDPVAPVMMAGSDEASAVFQKESLPTLTTFLKTELSERKSIGDSAYLLDPSQLTLKTDAEVRVYFIGEGAGYANSLGFNTLDFAAVSHSSGKGSKDDKLPAAIGADGQLIFPNASSSVSFYDPASNATRTKSAPLLPGDFVNLGKFEGGTSFDFFLIADGANDGETVYSTDASLNPDGINHVVAFAYALKDSPYLILGFEDLYGGGDKDFNDVLFAIDIGRANLAALTATPEPATLMTLGSFVGLGWALKRKNDNRTKGTRAV